MSDRYFVTVTQFGRVEFYREFIASDVAWSVAAKLAGDDPLRTVSLVGGGNLLFYRPADPRETVSSNAPVAVAVA